MNCEVVAVGTELLLGPVVDTNSTWIGQELASTGIDSYFHTAVGDNCDRIVQAIELALSRSDAVIVTGGLGPTHDDITRDAVARIMDAPLFTDDEVLLKIKAIFAARDREMPSNNELQAMRPEGSTVIGQRLGTAPGLICPVGNKVIYCLPGVPAEMKEMMTRSVLPDLKKRGQVKGVILSRFVNVWGTTESNLAEMVVDRLAALDISGNPKLALLAHGPRGIQIRITANGPDTKTATELLNAEEAELRTILGPLVFGIDDQTLESAVGDLLLAKELYISVAESVTGGLIASSLTAIPGGSGWFKGGVVSYASEVKFDVLNVPRGPVVSADTAKAMAEGVRSLLDADIGVGVTGVAGPAQQEDQPVGLVYVGLAMPSVEVEAFELHLHGDRQKIREMACAHALNAVRERLITRTN